MPGIDWCVYCGSKAHVVANCTLLRDVEDLEDLDTYNEKEQDNDTTG